MLGPTFPSTLDQVISRPYNHVLALDCYCLDARLRTRMTARVATKFLFFVCVSMHQSGQSIARSINSSVKITNAAQWPQIEGSPGLGRVSLLRDHCNERPHSGHWLLGHFEGSIE